MKKLALTCINKYLTRVYASNCASSCDISRGAVNAIDTAVSVILLTQAA